MTQIIVSVWLYDVAIQAGREDVTNELNHVFFIPQNFIT